MTGTSCVISNGLLPGDGAHLRRTQMCMELIELKCKLASQLVLDYWAQMHVPKGALVSRALSCRDCNYERQD